MKAWQVHAWGEPESMTFGEVPVPTPSPTQVLVKNKAASLNFFEVLRIQGKYQERPEFPWIPGSEVAGTVEAVGAQVTRFKPGDEVIAVPFIAGFAEYTVAEERVTFPLPAGMTPAQGASLPIAWQTSYFALKERGELREGQWLLVHAGASGVGMAAIQIGKAWGARVIATAGSAEKLAFCREMGAEHALDYSDAAWVDEVKRITGKGADMIYDPVGGDVFDLSSKCIAPYGKLLVIGFAGGRIPSIAANRILLKNMSVVGVLWGNHVKAFPAYPQEAHAGLTALHEAGKLHPRVTGSFRLDQVPEGLRALTGRRVLGKIGIDL